MALLGWLGASAFAAETVLYADEFRSALDSGWTWRREHAGMWRVANQGLEIRVEPGNLWGAANNARNVLVRRLPEVDDDVLELSVTVENAPTNQYEQANLAWYYDDGHMVKLGQELVNGKRCVVMGREFGDKTRTLGIHPLSTDQVRLRLRIEGNQIRGDFLPAGATAWQPAGAADLPAPPDGKAHASLHCYQGKAEVEHWARFTQFRLVRIGR